jgi:5'-AMP-activated protein kinase catalytic alpha subunit
MEEDLHIDASLSRNDTTDMCSSDGAAEQHTKTVKLEIQIYKIRTNEYMVDMQRLSGDSFLYIDVCANLMLRLQAIK